MEKVGKNMEPISVKPLDRVQLSECGIPGTVIGITLSGGKELCMIEWDDGSCYQAFAKNLYLVN